MHTVLIAEDEMLVRIGIMHMIDWAKNGYEAPAVAGDGQEALEYMRAHRPDIVLLDLNMPRMDGIAVLKRMREERLSTIPIVLTFHDEFDLVRESFRLGAVEYLLKNELTAESLSDMLNKIEDMIPKAKKPEEERSPRNALRQIIESVLEGEILPETEIPALRFALLRVRNLSCVKARYESGSIGQALTALSEIWQQEVDADRALLIPREVGLVLAVPAGPAEQADIAGYAARINEIAQLYLDISFDCVESEVVRTSNQLTQAFETLVVLFPARETTDRLTQDAMRYIALHYMENITVSDIAQQLFVSESLLSRKFNKHAGMSIPNYLNQYRVERAEALLKRTDLKIYEVAEQVGFNSVPYFCTMFKRLKGYTPGNRKDEDA